jgi:hypothetical protein
VALFDYRIFLVAALLGSGCSLLLAPRAGDSVLQDSEIPEDGGGEAGVDADADTDIDSDADTDTEVDTERDAGASCGDGVPEGDEECDDGAANSNTAPDACRLDCTRPRCGDGVQDSGERCDDGDTIDNNECSNGCVPVLTMLCQPCTAHDECGREQDLCVNIGGTRYCAIDCSGGAGCPTDFFCSTFTADVGIVDQCLPTSGECAECVDHDRDGYGIGSSCAGDDCNDGDPSIHPGATETCDGIDSNCSGNENDAIDAPVWYRDGDGDGFGDPRFASRFCDPPDGFVESNRDCDDTDPGVHPHADEVCDDIDNDCNGTTDDGCTTTDETCTGGEPGCAEDCSLPRLIAAPGDGASVEVTGSTTGANDDFRTMTCGGGGAPDHVFALDVAEADTYEMRTTDPGARSYDTVLILRSECDRSSSTIWCHDDIVPGEDRYSLIVRSLAAGRYFIIVDGYDWDDHGSYRLVVSRR